jgi:hypothetical protein
MSDWQESALKARVTTLERGIALADALARECGLFDGLDVMRHPPCNSDLVGLLTALVRYRGWQNAEEIRRDYYSGPPGSFTGD